MAIRQHLGQIAGDLGAILQTRAEIFSLELAEQRTRFFSLVGLFVLGLIFLLLALVIFSIFFIALFWPGEFRYWAIGGLAMGYLVIGISIMLRLNHRLNTEATPFAVTRQELSQDLALVSAWQTAMRSTSHRAERDSDSHREDFHAR